MLVTRRETNADRRGVILIVVLALLTLFTTIGLSFVLVAGNLAESAQNARVKEGQFQPDVDPETALSLFLGQLIYDVPDDAVGVYSAMRGHSLGRTMFGWNDEANALNNNAF